MRTGWRDAEHGSIEDVNDREYATNSKPRASFMPAGLARLVIFPDQHLKKLMSLRLAGVVPGVAVVPRVVVMAEVVVQVVADSEGGSGPMSKKHFLIQSRIMYILCPWVV